MTGGLLRGAGLRGAPGLALVGALGALGQAPLNLWPATVLAFAWLFARLDRGLPAPAAAAAAARGVWAFGAGYFAASLSWLISPFLVEPLVWGWAALPALAVMAGGLALFWAGAGWLAARSPHPRAALLVWLALAELGRGYLFTGFPWASPGHVWIATPLAQLAALVGPVGLCLLTLTLGALLARPSLVRTLAAGALLCGGYGYGTWALSLPMPQDRPVQLRLVQPNAAQDLKWDADQARVFFDRLMALTAVKPPVDLVIWPETALPYVMDDDPDLAARIGQAGNGAVLAVGRQRLEGVRGWNNLTFLSPAGRVLASYDKFHLVPFGEYVPFGALAHDLFGIDSFAPQTGAVYTAGPGPRVLDLGGDLGRVLPLICYEAIFPQGLNRTGRADWLLQITNDAWFGTLTGPWQHAEQARLRAIEQGLPLVRVANTGVSAVYDARGRQRGALPFGISSYLDLPLPGALAPTPYSRTGDLPLFLLLAGLGIALLWRRRPLRP